MVKQSESSTERIAQDIKQRIPRGVPVFGIIPYQEDLDEDNNLPNTEQVTRELHESANTIINNIRQKYTKVRSILITSVYPDEGKSTLAVALSLGYALQGNRVLLVDGDIREPELQRFFNLQNQLGFVDLILYGAELKKVVKKTNVENIFLISAGSNCVHPPSLFRRSGAGRILKLLESRAKIVIFDMCTTHQFGKDVFKLAQHVDLVLCVYNPQKNTSMREFVELIRKLTNMNLPISVGVVANEVGIKNNGNESSINTLTRLIDLNELKKDTPKIKIPKIPKTGLLIALIIFMIVAVGSWAHQPVVAFFKDHMLTLFEKPDNTPVVVNQTSPRIPPPLPDSSAEDTNQTQPSPPNQNEQTVVNMASSHPYSVHTESFKEMEYAGEYVKELRQKGYKAFFVPKSVSNSNWYRVLVGSFSTIEDADKAADVLRHQTPDDYAKTLSLPYAIWLGEFLSEKEALTFIKRLPAKYSAYMIAYQNKDEEARFGVFVGAFQNQSEQECKTLSQLLNVEGFPNQIVLR